MDEAYRENLIEAIDRHMERAEQAGLWLIYCFVLGAMPQVETLEEKAAIHESVCGKNGAGQKE